MAAGAFVLAGVASTRLGVRCALPPRWSARSPHGFRSPFSPRYGLRSGEPTFGNYNGYHSGGGSRSNTPRGNGSGPGMSSNSELYAASPELDALLLQSSDAPVLMHIVSYNVLSSSLAGPSHFRACDPSNLDANTRLSRVIAKLEEHVATRAVICLQEVSLTWAGPLQAFFASRQFQFVIASYGSYFNGYMGVGLAYPTTLFEALDIKIERLTDAHKWPVAPAQTGIVKAVADLRTRIVRVWQAMFADLNSKKSRSRSSGPADVWRESRDRRNMLIFARLRCKTNGGRICVGTYHMPCAFYSPPQMVIHSALVVSRFQDHCAADPGVLAGDFNIKPRDSCYSMITSGKINPSDPAYPAATPDGSSPEQWMPTLRYPMKSAYAQVLGHEPDFTNYAQVRDDPPFIDTLDYIFCSEDVDVADVVRLPHRSTVTNGPFPAQSEPSDHVLIGAVLRLPAASTKATDSNKKRRQRGTAAK